MKELCEDVAVTKVDEIVARTLNVIHIIDLNVVNPKLILMKSGWLLTSSVKKEFMFHKYRIRPGAPLVTSTVWIVFFI